MSQETHESSPLVLIAEDDADLRYLLRARLERGGFEVDEAVDGFEALERFRAREPDVIILDVEMPKRSGYEVMLELRDQDEDALPPIIFLTAQSTDVDIVKSMDLGAHDHIAKPFNADVLIAKAKAAARGKLYRDELRTRGDDMSQLAHTDVLTGVSNRRELEDRMGALTALAKRRGNPFTALMIDVDYFKNVNDVHGHGHGDQTLKEVAARIASQLRQEDVLGRWGGEEFLVLLPMTESVGAHAVAERIRMAVAREPIDVDKGDHVTVSVGGAQWSSTTDLLLAADVSLYESKRKGRNQVTMAAQ